MVKLSFENAVVEDTGYGLEVNGISLQTIISTAIGTRLGNKKAGYGGELPSFKSNSCDVVVIISPHPQTTNIETEEEHWESLKELEEDKLYEYEQKTKEADPEE